MVAFSSGNILQITAIKIFEREFLLDTPTGAKTIPL